MTERRARDSENLRIHRAISRASRLVDSRAALQKIAEGVTEVAGFRVVAICHLRDEDTFQVVAVSGNPDARTTLLDTTIERASFEHELSYADKWGSLLFVPEGRVPDDEQVPSWVPPDLELVDDTNAWRAEDLLVAPIFDEAGATVGLLSVDLPEDGLRPGPEKCRLLEQYAVQAGRAILDTLARGRLAEQVRLSAAVHAVMRTASAHLSLDRILEDSQQTLIDSFRAYAIWLQTSDGAGLNSSTAYQPHDEELRFSDGLRTLARRASRVCWSEQRTAVASRTSNPPGLTEEQEQLITDHLERTGLTSLLFVPVGAGPECLGYLVLSRRGDSREWNELEAAAALEIGHDLGRAILNARLFEHEQRLVRELTEIDNEKSQLISTISHELKNPLTAILGHAELLDADPAIDNASRSSLESIERNAGRLSRIAEDLLLLSSIGGADDPGADGAGVDLRDVIEDALDVLGLQAESRDISVDLHKPDEPALVRGPVADLDRLCTNLVSNALKYTRKGGAVSIVVAIDHDNTVLSVTDNGIGISRADQEKLFGEFFRSTNPEALGAAGTGLGLTIVQRIVERHGGRIDVRSEPGEGSTFTVTLPGLDQ